MISPSWSEQSTRDIVNLVSSDDEDQEQASLVEAFTGLRARESHILRDITNSSASIKCTPYRFLKTPKSKKRIILDSDEEGSLSNSMNVSSDEFFECESDHGVEEDKNIDENKQIMKAFTLDEDQVEEVHSESDDSFFASSDDEEEFQEQDESEFECDHDKEKYKSIYDKSKRIVNSYTSDEDQADSEIDDSFLASSISEEEFQERDESEFECDHDKDKNKSIDDKSKRILKSYASDEDQVDSESDDSFLESSISEEEFQERDECSEEESTLKSHKCTINKLTRLSRSSLVEKYLKEFNDSVFGREIPGDLSVQWNPRLTKTAGLTYTTSRRQNGVTFRSARIELSEKVVDSEYRLQCTLLHELCHVAAWLVDHKSKPPHGPHFQKWASKASLVHPQHSVTTCHSYDIQYKYIYECGDCLATFKRHSKSIDVTKQSCGRCRGTISLKGTVDKDGTIKKPRAASKFSCFVKEHYGEVRAKCACHATTMKQIGVLWKEQKS